MLRMGGGVCGAIFSAAGAEKLTKECSSIGHVETGSSVITSGCDLPAKYIIHTAGPIHNVYTNGTSDEAKLLRSCYHSSLKLAEQYNMKSIAFPLISSGIYGYPKKKAFQIASETILDFLKNSDMTVYLILFNTDGLDLISERLKSYIDDHYVDEMENRFKRKIYEHRWTDKHTEFPPFSASLTTKRKNRELEAIIRNKDESFSQMLIRLIDEKGFSDVEIYKKANCDRKLFSKIRCDRNYKPKKTTVLAFAIALELSLDETIDLLKTAGFTLSNSSVADIIVRFYIENEVYDIFEINCALCEYNENLLGGQRKN
ncbi:MAG: macro domain-containing protein [Alistipes sp.]|nr:macro domain-containing protein [Alistipes sp.]